MSDARLIDQGGPAFPELGNVGYNSDWQSESGMTLRDWFAGKALPSIITQLCELPVQEYADLGKVYGLKTVQINRLASLMSYAQADEMIVARNGGAVSNGAWNPIDTMVPNEGAIVMGYGEYRERDGFSPAIMRWYGSVNGWTVNGMPFYPTHWMELPAAPKGGA